MKGKHKVIVSTKRLKYEFELRRNLTIIQGDSATGLMHLVYCPLKLTASKLSVIVHAIICYKYR